MQSSAPELIALVKEDNATLESYGVEPGKASFAANCLLARRLVERGVRFVQLYHTDWDHHGSGGENLATGLDKVCREVDRPAAALVKDLKRRGLLDSTLVVWGGEFGRTPMGEVRDTVGRNHHIDAYTSAQRTSSASQGWKTASTSTTSKRPCCTCWGWTTPSSRSDSRAAIFA
jgi:hypothetical protein